MDSIAEIIHDIRDHHRTRNFAMDQRKRADLALGAYLRTQFGWRKIPDGLSAKEVAEIEKVNKSARLTSEKIMKTAEAVVTESLKPEGKARVVDTSVEGFDRLGFVAISAVRSRSAFDQVEKNATSEMERLAGRLPVWGEFGESVKGFGKVSLAVIVAEAGDLSRFDNPGKLWKRMGLAPHVGNDGAMHLPSAFGKNDLTKAEWINLGYNRRRRSRMFVIGDALLKHKNAYREIYLERRAFEHRKAEMECLTPVTTGAETVKSWEKLGLPPITLVKKFNPDLHRSAGHMTKRAQVYVEKRLLKHLWQHWRRLSDLPWEEPEFKNAA